MAWDLGRSPTGRKMVENDYFNGANDSDDGEVKAKKKKTNSWDDSSSTTTSAVLTPKRKLSDWDVSSECHETMVEPFNDKTAKEFDDNFDSDVDPNEKVTSPFGEMDERPKTEFGSGSSFNFLGTTALGSCELEQNSLFSSVPDHKEKRRSSRDSMDSQQRQAQQQKGEEDSLLVEDIEEFFKDDWSGSNRSDAEGTGRKTNETEDSILDDTTVWMIPKSDRSRSTGTDSKLVSASEREKIDALDIDVFVKRAKSSSSMPKRTKSAAKSSRSDCLHNLKGDDISFKNLPMIYEGSKSHQKSTTLLSKSDRNQCSNNTDQTKVDELGVYFAEYECRTVTVDGDAPNLGNGYTDGDEDAEDIHLNVENRELMETIPHATEVGPTIPENPENYDREHRILAGTSNQTSLEVVSLPDILGRCSLKERQQKEKFGRRLNTPGATRPETETGAQPTLGMRRANESWFLLDETGQYQAVTRDEVAILLNGRSADAVLQRHKEHFIQSPALPDSLSQNGSLGAMLTKESIQTLLRGEDTGGEDRDKEPIDLERKVENTLLYIQPGINLTASIRIIPVETEMIHIWRRNRDNGSMLSSDVDLRLQASQDSVETSNARNSNDHHAVYLPRMIMEKQQQTVVEQDEMAAFEVPPSNPSLVSDSLYNGNSTGYVNNADKNEEAADNQTSDYSRLLIETRKIVDSLTNSFKVLQNRLDGETNRSCALQGEINKLRQLLKEPTDKIQNEENSRETIVNQQQLNVSACSSVRSSLQLEKETPKNESIAEEIPTVPEDAVGESSESTAGQQSHETIGDMRPSTDYITVNIYTTDTHPKCSATGVQETNSLLQANLGIIEGKMKKLEQENDLISKQNSELKRKLKEISLELEKYLASTTESDVLIEEDKDVDTLRDQVCNLKLELDNLKKISRRKEKELKTKNALLREELEGNTKSLQEWLITTGQVFREVKNLISKLDDTGISTGNYFGLDEADSQEPGTFLWFLNSFLRQITEQLIDFHAQNFERDKNAGTGKQYEVSMTNGLEKVKSECHRLMEQFRNGHSIPGEHVIDDYFAIIMEKASLMEEIKIIKTENEILTANQLEHHEKLRETIISLKDSKNEISALQSAQKLSENEKSQMMKVLKLYEDEKASLEEEIQGKNGIVTELLEDQKVKETQLQEMRNKLKLTDETIKNLEISYRMRDDLITQVKYENEQLLKMEEAKETEIQELKSCISDLETQRTQLESEITSTKLFMNQSQKEMTDYINHLESIINTNQETLDKNKQKLKDNNQILSRLKTENEALDKQYQCELKLYNKAKDELNVCNEKLLSVSEKQKLTEEERDRLSQKFQNLENSEKKTMETLNSVTRECKRLQNENAALKERLEGYSKDRDESLKEQKDLINKYAMLSKELQKIQDKYRNVKAECNDRANVIRYLETMLKENMLEYNNKIVYLENNITHILDKIAACKNTIREKRGGVDPEVLQLRQQLDMTHQERKELENVIGNYYSAMKHLECEIQNREKEVNELNVKLSLEQKKWFEISKEHKSEEMVERKIKDPTKDFELSEIKQLQCKILTAENEMSECKKQLSQNEANHENEKKKLELTIADLKSELNRYQIRMEVMMKNLSNCNKNLNFQSNEKRNSEEMMQKLQVMSDEIKKKDKKIAELCDIVNKFKQEITTKENELFSAKQENLSISEMVKNLKNHLGKMENALSLTSRGSQRQEKEKNEMAEKLLQSIKIIMEEKSAKQTIEMLAAEKEKSYNEQLLHLKGELEAKISTCASLSNAVEEKKKLVVKLQQDIKKIKSENYLLKTEVVNYKKINSFHDGNEVSSPTYLGDLSSKTNSLTQLKVKNFSPERLEACLRELKEVRDINLLLRKSEGESQSKIVRLEDEIRDSRIMVKELEGRIKIERKSKKALKTMIAAAKMEIERCLIGKQILSTVADRITRHLKCEETQYKGRSFPHRSTSYESLT